MDHCLVLDISSKYFNQFPHVDDVAFVVMFSVIVFMLRIKCWLFDNLIF